MIWWMLWRWGSTEAVVPVTTVGHVTLTARALGQTTLAARAVANVTLGARN